MPTQVQASNYTARFTTNGHSDNKRLHLRTQSNQGTLRTTDSIQ